MMRKKWLKLLRSPSIILIGVALSMILSWPAQQALIAEGRDIRQDYIGAQRLMRRADLYAPFSQSEYDALGVNRDQGMPMNFHPPTTLLFFMPFTYLDFRSAVILWSLLSFLFFFVSVYMIASELDLPGVMAASLFAALWFPLWLHIRFGQFSTLVLLLLTLMWWNLKRNRQAAAGTFLALASLVKLFPLFILLFFVLTRRWRALTQAVIIVAVVMSAVYLWYPQGTLAYFADIARQNAEAFSSYFGNSGLSGFLGRVFVGSSDVAPLVYWPELQSVLSGILSVVLLGLITLYALRDADWEMSLSLFIVGSLLLSPTTWVHNWVILILPWALIYRRTLNRVYLRTRFFLLLILIVSAIPHWQIFEWLKTRYGLPLPYWIGLLSPGFYALTGTFLLLLTQRHSIFHDQQ